ncbi:Arp2/3 complex, 34 kd subunit p34-Arc-domain-containing protein [Haematococcus lacustris]
MAQVETLGIVPESKAVFELIMRYLTALVENKSPPPPHHHLHEFDDCQYLVHGDSAGGLRLSFALPCLEDCFREQLLTENTLELIQGAYQGMATVLQPPEPGYQVSLQLEVRVLTRISPADRAYWVRLMASIRQLVTGQPLRFHFSRLGEGRSAPGPVEVHCSRPGKEYFVKPHAQSVTVILPVRFLTVQDAAIGHAVLQEFADARRQASLGNAPSCAYFPAKSPPPEVMQVPAALLDGVSGFMSFTVTERHVRAAHIEEVVWSLHTFRILIGFHITSCKAMIHARMRVCADRLSSSLDLRGTQPLPLDISARQPVALTQANHPAGWKPVQP